MIDSLTDAIERSDLLIDAHAQDGIVIGRARVEAAGSDVWVNVDPELDDNEEPDVPTLVAGVERVLAISDVRWRELIDEVAAEIEDAVGDEPVEEATDLRVDLTLRSVVVFVDATLLRFVAPRQFPDGWIRVQLDEELNLDDLTIEGSDDDDSVAFDSLDDLLDEISRDQ